VASAHSSVPNRSRFRERNRTLRYLFAYKQTRKWGCSTPDQIARFFHKPTGLADGLGVESLPGPKRSIRPCPDGLPVRDEIPATGKSSTETRSIQTSRDTSPALGSPCHCLDGQRLRRGKSYGQRAACQSREANVRIMQRGHKQWKIGSGVGGVTLVAKNKVIYPRMCTKAHEWKTRNS
jgi:hypothetical protein